MPFKLPYTSYIRITFTGRLILYCLNSAYSAPNNNNTKSVHIIKRRTTIHDTAIRRRILYCIYTIHWPPKIALPYVLWHARETLTHNNNNETTHEPKENSQHFGVRNQKKRAPAMSKICYAKEKSSSRKVRAQHRRQTQHIWDNTSPSIRNHNKLCVRDQPMCMCVFFLSVSHMSVCVSMCVYDSTRFSIYIYIENKHNALPNHQNARTLHRLMGKNVHRLVQYMHSHKEHRFNRVYQYKHIHKNIHM